MTEKADKRGKKGSRKSKRKVCAFLKGYESCL